MSILLGCVFWGEDGGIGENRSVTQNGNSSGRRTWGKGQAVIARCKRIRPHDARLDSAKSIGVRRRALGKIQYCSIATRAKTRAKTPSLPLIGTRVGFVGEQLSRTRIDSVVIAAISVLQPGRPCAARALSKHIDGRRPAMTILLCGKGGKKIKGPAAGDWP